jgi:hypothetical protein
MFMPWRQSLTIGLLGLNSIDKLFYLLITASDWLIAFVFIIATNAKAKCIPLFNVFSTKSSNQTKAEGNYKKVDMAIC